MASYATDDDLTSRIPATAAATPTQRAFALVDAMAMINLDAYGDNSTRAHVLLAAHYLTLSGAIAGGGEGGIVSSVKAGEIAATFATGSTAGIDPLLGSTTHGRQFLQIQNTLVSRPEVQ